jgi:HEAT repeats
MRISVHQSLVVAAMSVGFSFSSHGGEPTVPSPPPPLSAEATYALTSLDGVPTPAQLEVLIPNALDTLRKHAESTSGATQIRLRAIRAISLWPPSAENQITLKQVLAANSSSPTGPSVLLTQAAIESLGRQAGAEDTELLGAVTASLTHPSRDVRFAAARSLRQIGSRDVLVLGSLYACLDTESVPAVKLAITEAIQALSEGR